MIILERDGFRDGFISNFESGRLMTRFDFIEDESLSLRGNRRDNRWPSLVANDRSIQLLFWMITFPAEIKSAEICGDLWRSAEKNLVHTRHRNRSKPSKVNKAITARNYEISSYFFFNFISPRVPPLSAPLSAPLSINRTALHNGWLDRSKELPVLIRANDQYTLN